MGKTKLFEQLCFLSKLVLFCCYCTECTQKDQPTAGQLTKSPPVGTKSPPVGTESLQVGTKSPPRRYIRTVALVSGTFAPAVVAVALEIGSLSPTLERSAPQVQQIHQHQKVGDQCRDVAASCWRFQWLRLSVASKGRRLALAIERLRPDSRRLALAKERLPPDVRILAPVCREVAARWQDISRVGHPFFSKELYG